LERLRNGKVQQNYAKSVLRNPMSDSGVIVAADFKHHICFSLSYQVFSLSAIWFVAKFQSNLMTIRWRLGVSLGNFEAFWHIFWYIYLHNGVGNQNIAIGKRSAVSGHQNS